MIIILIKKELFTHDNTDNCMISFTSKSLNFETPCCILINRNRGSLFGQVFFQARDKEGTSIREKTPSMTLLLSSCLDVWWATNLTKRRHEPRRKRDDLSRERISSVRSIESGVSRSTDKGRGCQYFC